MQLHAVGKNATNPAFIQFKCKVLAISVSFIARMETIAQQDSGYRMNKQLSAGLRQFHVTPGSPVLTQ
ncbi:hypothetical protein CAter282_0024 [Collimonas arenae]|uniref:Uncharacterized protein n=1 Tax=Collimonas arenae TaxID=279058 RepID=A0A127QCR1_9BURK|nr:hypothetical protein CAter10_0024 [Collimonas arenae]AMP07848.1 hypothetical protein CAter282_0024 [Collimonas arenae]